MISKRGPDVQNELTFEKLKIFASVLHIRGLVSQPIERDGLVFAWNGEVFGRHFEFSDNIYDVFSNDTL